MTLANNVQVEQSLFFSKFEAYRSTHTDLDHLTMLGLLDLLLDFVKETYTSTTEGHSTQPAVPPGRSKMPLATISAEFLPPSQPAPKIVESKLMEAQLSASAKDSKNDGSMAHASYTSNHLYFRPLFSDDASSGTTFELESELSREDMYFVFYCNVEYMSLRLLIKCMATRQDCNRDLLQTAVSISIYY